MNRKLVEMLRTVISPDDVNWDKHLNDVQFAINNSVNVSTGETPHFWLYGHSKHMSCTLLDDAIPPRKINSYEDYLSNRTTKAYQAIK